MIATLPREILLPRRVEFPAWVRKLGEPLKMFGHGAFGKPFAQPMGGAGVAAFDPLDLTWALSYDASLESYANNDSVTILNDQSGNNRDATEATNPPTFKTNIQNSKPGISFDGSNDKLTTPYVPTLPIEIFFVVKTGNSTNSGARLFAHGFTRQLLLYDGTSVFDVYAGSFLKSTVALNLHTSYIVRIVFNGANSEISVNNETTVSGTTGASTPSTSITFGAGDGSFTDIHLFAFYETPAGTTLSAAQRTNMWNYLSEYWGIAIS